VKDRVSAMLPSDREELEKMKVENPRGRERELVTFGGMRSDVSAALALGSLRICLCIWIDDNCSGGRGCDSAICSPGKCLLGAQLVDLGEDRAESRLHIGRVEG
jgi:hypothetical protein